MVENSCKRPVHMIFPLYHELYHITSFMDGGKFMWNASSHDISPKHWMHYIINGFSGNSVNFTTGNPDIFVFRVAKGNFMGNASYLYR